MRSWGPHETATPSGWLSSRRRQVFAAKWNALQLENDPDYDPLLDAVAARVRELRQNRRHTAQLRRRYAKERMTHHIDWKNPMLRRFPYYAVYWFLRICLFAFLFFPKLVYSALFQFNGNETLKKFPLKLSMWDFCSAEHEYRLRSRTVTPFL